MSAFYEILGVSSDAEPEVIQAAYRALMRKYHPDVTGGAQADARAKRVTEAYVTLSDPARRAAYDAKICANDQGLKAKKQNEPSNNNPKPAANIGKNRSKEILEAVTGLVIFTICLAALRYFHLNPNIASTSDSHSNVDQSELLVGTPSPSKSSPAQTGEASRLAPAPTSDLDHAVATAVTSIHSGEANHMDGFYLLGGDDNSFQLIDLTQSHFRPAHGGVAWVVNVLKKTQIYDDIIDVDYSWARYKAICSSDLLTITHMSYNRADGSIIKAEDTHLDIRVVPETLGSNILKAICDDDFSSLTKEPQMTVGAILKHIRGSSTIPSSSTPGLSPQAELYKAVGSLDGTADASQEGRTINP